MTVRLFFINLEISVVKYTNKNVFRFTSIDVFFMHREGWFAVAQENNIWKDMGEAFAQQWDIIGLLLQNKLLYSVSNKYILNISFL